jgi:DhnA family fructose-bisphosphate aldolase class Ia
LTAWPRPQLRDEPGGLRSAVLGCVGIGFTINPGSEHRLEMSSELRALAEEAKASLAERVHHVVQAAFAGRRIVIFSGGVADTDQAVFDQVRAIRDGGGFGSIGTRSSAGAVTR